MDKNIKKGMPCHFAVLYRTDWPNTINQLYFNKNKNKTPI